MAAKKDKQGKFLNAEQAEELFSRVDETGHDNAEAARRQRARRKEKGQGVDIDPLSGSDPSGSDVDVAIRRTAVLFVVLTLAIVMVSQVSCSVVRRLTTSNLSDRVDVSSVSGAMRNGVEWGNGFTQFPEQFTVLEADENTGRIEVSVTDTSSKNALQCFAGSQVQATAFAVNSLLNPNINTVVYHVNVHMDSEGKIQQSQLFGFLKPTGDVKSIMTFIWTKTQSSAGVNFSCTITGIDETLQDELRDQITTSFTPVQILTGATN